MSWAILDEENTIELPPKERFAKYDHILKNEKDSSKRWDAVWLIGELARNNKTDSLFDQVSDLLAWALENDDDGVVKHEICYQIAASDMRDKIPDLLHTALHNKSSLARHEAIEVLGSMQAHETKNELKKALKDPVSYVRETAVFAIRRLERLEKRKDHYSLTDIL